MEKNQFIKFARACSVEDTIHQLHFLNWIQYVFGACHVDWVYNQEKCVDMHRKYDESRKIAMAEVSHLFTDEAIPWKRFFEGEEYINPLNKINIVLALIYRRNFEDYFLSDENGKPLNRYKDNVCDGSLSNFFTQSPTMFRSAFSFNDDIKLQANLS